MHVTRRTLPWKHAVAKLALSLAAIAPAHAADYEGPIKVLVGFPPGGATDVVARLLSDKLKDLLKQPIVIENRGGAGGMIATQQLRAAPPDGSTVMLTIDHSHVIVPLTFRPSNRPRNVRGVLPARTLKRSSPLS